MTERSRLTGEGEANGHSINHEIFVLAAALDADPYAGLKSSARAGPDEIGCRSA